MDVGAVQMTPPMPSTKPTNGVKANVIVTPANVTDEPRSCLVGSAFGLSGHEPNGSCATVMLLSIVSANVVPTASTSSLNVSVIWPPATLEVGGGGTQLEAELM